MCNYNILFLNADIEYSRQVSQTLSLPVDVKFSFADSGMQALSLISEQEMHLLIIHENLSHKMRGTEVCGLLMQKSKTSTIPIILVNDKLKKIPKCTNIIKYLNENFTSDELQILIETQYSLAHKNNPLEIEKRLILSIVNRIHSPIFIIDHEKVSFANKCFLDFFKVKDLDELPVFYPKIQDLFLHKKDEIKFSHIDWLKELLTSDEDQEVIMRNKDEERLFLRLRGELLEHSDEYLIITQDISTEIAHAKEIEKLYSIDHLTKLPNRLKLIGDLEEHDELALAILDIDDFKLINDFYGHIIGDFVIFQVAKRISNYISHENLILYRLPSDSFAVLNKQKIEKEYFEIIILSLIQIVSKSPFIYTNNEEDIEILVNLSAGIVFEKEFALAHTDLALREAKKNA